MALLIIIGCLLEALFVVILWDAIKNDIIPEYKSIKGITYETFLSTTALIIAIIFVAFSVYGMILYATGELSIAYGIDDEAKHLVG